MTDVETDQITESREIYGQLNVLRKEIRICHVEDKLDGSGRVRCRLQVVSLAQQKSRTSLERGRSPVRELHDDVAKLSMGNDSTETDALAADEASSSGDLPTNEASGCSVNDSAQSTKPEYKAISWTWGDPNKNAQIVLNDQVFEVSQNAEVLLRRLCFEQQHSTIWLDAICVNQADLAERGQQVAIMREVYTSATQVLVWLGEDQQGIAEAVFSSIDMLVAQCMDHVAEQNASLNEVFFEGKNINISDGPLPDCDWSALRLLFSHSWFTRLWVVQEVLLGTSPQLYCGTRSRAWSEVGLAAQWLDHRAYERNWYMQEIITGIDLSARMWRLSRVGISPLLLLRLSVHLDATEPLDKVYGILGLLAQSAHSTGENYEELRIVPDYTADLASVYAQITKGAMSSHLEAWDAMWILETAQIQVPRTGQGRDRDDPDWPTWVPRYHWQQDINSGTPQYIGCRGHAADKIPWQPHSSYQNSTKVLKVQGVVVSRVTSHNEPLTTKLWRNDSLRYEWISRCGQVASEIGQDSRATALTLTCEMTSNFGDAVKTSDHTAHYEEFVTSCQGKVFKDLPPGPHDYVQAVYLASANRVFFTMADEGGMGMGPPGMQVDDLVCILFGARVACVLREQGEHYIYVGAAYVLGLMQGQYVRYLREEGQLEEKTQWFEIH